MRVRSRSNPLNIWPGFVDALAALVLVMLFAFMIFVITQSYLSNALNTQEKSLQGLNEIISSLRKTLALTQKEKAELQGRTQILTKEQAQVKALLDAETKTRAHEASTLEAHKETVAQLRLQLDELNAQLRSLMEALATSEEKSTKKETEVEELTLKLNKALAAKMKELSTYRSVFFGKLRQVLGKREDMRIVGDRFVFQSEVLFAVGSATVGEEGRKKLHQLAKALKEIQTQIPSQVDWILRIDGHTDMAPIKNSTLFASNWELSMSRALAVVHALIQEGIPEKHLVAAAFGEFHPIDSGTTPANFAKNRRIEFKLDQR